MSVCRHIEKKRRAYLTFNKLIYSEAQTNEWINFNSHTNVYWKEKINNSLGRASCSEENWRRKWGQKYNFFLNRNIKVNVMVFIQIISNLYKKVPMKTRSKRIQIDHHHQFKVKFLNFIFIAKNLLCSSSIQSFKYTFIKSILSWSIRYQKSFSYSIITKSKYEIIFIPQNFSSTIHSSL